MKEMKSIRTTTFASGNYRIDIVESRTEYEAWIYHKDYGVKDFMFGTDKNQAAYIKSFEEFTDMVEANLPVYKKSYHERHED